MGRQKSENYFHFTQLNRRQRWRAGAISSWGLQFDKARSQVFPLLSPSSASPCLPSLLSFFSLAYTSVFSYTNPTWSAQKAAATSRSYPVRVPLSPFSTRALFAAIPNLVRLELAGECCFSLCFCYFLSFLFFFIFFLVFSLVLVAYWYSILRHTTYNITNHQQGTLLSSRWDHRTAQLWN